MDFNFDNILIFLILILPGFLTTRLVTIRTASKNTNISLLEETSESILRSIFIHLLLIFITSLLLVFFFNCQTAELIKELNTIGFNDFLVSRSQYVLFFFSLWMLISFILATLSGYFWDPLDVISNKLVQKTGALTEDPYFKIISEIKFLSNNFTNSDIWIQARLLNGNFFAGIFKFASFPNEESQEREIIITEAVFLNNEKQLLDDITRDYVIINTKDCISLEIITINGNPRK